MRSRVLTGLVLVAVALLLVFAASPLVGWAASLVLGFLGGLELAPLVFPRRPNRGKTLAIACLCAILAGTLPPVLALLAALAGALFLAFSPDRGWLHAIAGLAWIGGGLAGLRTLATMHPEGLVWDPRPIVLLLLLPIWAADTFAYFGGRAFGKRPLAPTVSPKKTVEGAICGLAAAVIVGGLAGRWLGPSISVGLLVGLLAGTFGPAGDLLESLLKRRADVKDSGTLLPGHGGVLDRIDSLLLAAPVVAVVLVR